MSKVTVDALLSVPRPKAHIANIELRISGLEAETDLAMAAWCPGSYVIRDYARYLRGVTAQTPGGDALPLMKTGKHDWHLHPAGAGEVVVRYQVYGRELTVRTNHITDSHAFLHGPATWLYLPEHRDAVTRVRVDLPEGRDWSVTTGLAREGDRFVADNVDTLLDGPLHLGATENRSFEVGGVPFELCIWGLPGHLVARADDLVADLVPILEAHRDRFGAFPCDRYSFILMLSPGAYGGLEHKTSSANLSCPVKVFADAKGYAGLLELLSHEFFHAWNGKRMMPAALQPFRYEAEQPTRCLWVVEGITSYVDRYTVRRAGKIEEKAYFEKLLDEYARLSATPGRLQHSLEESSFDAWIKLYQPHESNWNTTVSYYLKGGLVALALDLEIRRQTAGARTLDDALRAMWEKYRREGYPEDVQELLETATATDLATFFDDYIKGRRELDLNDFLPVVGLRIVTEVDDECPAWAGLVLSGNRVASVSDGGPAQGVVEPEDEILFVEGIRVQSDGDIRSGIMKRQPGDRVTLVVDRGGSFRELSFLLEQSPPRTYKLRGIPECADGPAESYRAWMDSPHPGDAVIAEFSEVVWS